MRIVSALVVLLLACNVRGAEAPTILIFGDSLSAGYGIEVDQSWATLLQSRLAAQGYEHRVVNASISGETTEGGVAGIRSALDSFRPALVILELGGNDGLRGIPPSRMKENLEKIVRTAQGAGAAVVMLGIRIPSNYGPRYRDEFENAFRDVAATCKIRWIEFFMEGIAENPELMQDDGIHPNAAAQPRLLDNAWPIIHAALDERN
jgi:acyl-CoA thioesterase I